MECTRERDSRIRENIERGRNGMYLHLLAPTVDLNIDGICVAMRGISVVYYSGLFLILRLGLRKRRKLMKLRYVR